MGKAGVFELICTPEQLAAFQCVAWAESDVIVTNATSHVCHVCGDRTLLDSFNAAKAVRFETLVEVNGDGKMISFRKFLTLKLLEGIRIFFLAYFMILFCRHVFF
jgi:hypothetical protein